MSDIDVEFSIIVPCFNEKEAIFPAVEEIISALSEDVNYEIIVVDDGSTDGTAGILEEIESRYSQVIIIQHVTNIGYGAALKTGLRTAEGKLIVITDADGTYPNMRIQELVDCCYDKDMVVGARVGDGVEYSKVRAFAKYFLGKWASWIAKKPIPDINSGLRVMRKSVVERFMGILPDTFSFTTTITLAMLTNYYTVEFVPISYKHRVGSSKIKPIRDTLRFIMLIARTGVYFAPMRVFAPLVLFLLASASVSLFYDIFVISNLTDKTILLFLFALNAGMVALLADMIDKRS